MRRILIAAALIATAPLPSFPIGSEIIGAAPAQAQEAPCKQLAGVRADYERMTPTVAVSSRHGTYSVGGFTCIRFLGDRWTFNAAGTLVAPASIPVGAPVANCDAAYNSGVQAAVNAANATPRRP